MSMHKVTFLLEEREVEVDENATLMEAAERADLYINSLCGGKGVCGRCRIQVTGGRVRADKHSISFLSREEIKEGYVLACQTKVHTDMEVVIPPESRLEAEQIVMEGGVVDYSQPEKIFVSRVASDPLSLFEPLAQKVYLQLEEPSKEDNIADSDRVIRELKRKTGYADFERSLRCLQGLASKLRSSGWKVTATIARHGDRWRILQIEPGDTSSGDYGVAVDVGTTTVVAQLVHLKSGNVLGVEGSHNLQARYGEDVISRMIFACSTEEGLHSLHMAIVKVINDLIKTLANEKRIDVKQIIAIVAAGNTTMSHLLLGLKPCSIRLDPYVPTAHSFPQIKAHEIDIDINPEGILEILPNVASYVGGDIVAGVLACGIADSPDIKALIDVGTNGEIALGNNDWMVCCSASAGPAFEGSGISSGMRATRGAIQKVEIRDGKVTYQTIGKGRPRGICGSGLIDCMYELVRNGIIDQQGKFNPSTKHERVVEKDGEPGFIVVYSQDTEAKRDLTIMESDMSNLIRSKAAVFAAIKSLVDYVGLSFNEIDSIYVAGGFGSYLNISKAVSIGLLPDIDPQRIKFVGNSSLLGARMALLSCYAFERTAKIASGMTNIELSTYQPFMDEYVAALFLPHTNMRLFPSAEYTTGND